MEGVILTVAIAIATCLLLIITSLKLPTITIKNHQIDTFWLVSLLGAILILLTRGTTLKAFFLAITANSAINPLKIIILLISLTMLSTTLDELAFFNYLACFVVKHVKHSQVKLFFILYLLIAVLTIFTSNDIVILTFTLFICYFAKRTKINPIPYLVMEFIVANTYSMIFIIGNPTNIYLATTSGISFLAYFKVMFLPTIASGLVATLVLYLLFRKSLKNDFEEKEVTTPRLKNISLTVISLIALFLTIIMLVISNYINVEMWLITAIAAISLTICLLIFSIKKKDATIVKQVYKRIPWALSIFVLSMFVIVLALSEKQVLTTIANTFNSIAHDNKLLNILTYGISSALCDNLINNIPMSLAYANMINMGTSSFQNAQIYATIIGSNIGAFLTPIGALAGIMWMHILKEQKVNFSFAKFTAYGSILTSSILLTALLCLYTTI